MQAAAPSSTLSRKRERAGVRVPRARDLRQTSTDAERKLWHHLRDRRLAGCKFRRQHAIGGFFADFACIEAGLVVELDGGQRFEPEAMRRDAARTAALNAAGFEVIRFDDRQVLVEMEAVLEVILRRVQERCVRPHPHPSPLPQAGEGANVDPHPGPHTDPLPRAGEGARSHTMNKDTK